MKLPEKKQKELEGKGKRKSPPVPGGGAMGRLRQFEKERGLKRTNIGNPAADEPSEKKDKNDQGSDTPH
jgi:hypothetical protein